MELRDKIGQMIMTGYPSEEITPELIELIEKYKLANIILFSNNLRTVDQAYGNCRRLHQKIEESTGYPAFIATDQEGGVVARLPEQTCNIPGAMLLGAAGRREYAYRAGFITGVELKALGINMDLAPVLDVNSNPDNPVIGVRSYSDDAHAVKEFGLSMIKGLEAAGVMAVVKHFPGHGDTAVDSHLGLPVVKKELDALMENELLPFRAAIKEGVPCVMTSHILFPKLEKENIPATMSRTILTGLLREKMGFNGLIITDCLEMAAIRNYYGTVWGAAEAVKAGAQLLCISHTPGLVIEAIRKIEEAVEAGNIPMELIDRAVENILKLKEKYRIDYNKKNLELVGSREHKAAIDEMTLAGVTKVSEGGLPDITQDTVFMGSYAYRSTLASSLPDKGLHFARYMSAKMGCDYLDVPVNPEEDEINAVLSRLKHYSRVVYGLYNGHLNRGQITLANEIARAGHSVLAVTLRDPYDLALLDENIHKIALYEYDAAAFDALERVLAKRAEAVGRLPVKLAR